MKRLAHVPALDGVRGIAILLVVADHAFAVGGGFLGVELFFVLSGYLITTLLLREHADTARIDLRGFYVRRVRRLYPALVATLVAWLAISAAGVAPRSFEHEVVGVLVSGTYVANAASAWFYPLPEGLRHLWTLAVEEQFYAFWPLVLLWLVPRRRMLTVLVAAFFAVAALRTGLTLTGTSSNTLYESPVTTGGGLIAGCAVAALAASYRPSLERLRNLLSSAGLVSLASVVALATWGPGNEARLYYEWLLPLVDLACAITLLSIAVSAAGPVRACSPRWLQWCGRVSYSLYLIHPIILVELVIEHRVLTPLEAVVLSLLAAWLMHRFIERPLRYRRPAGRPAATRPVLVTPS